MSTAAERKPMVDMMADTARTWTTERLEAHREEGLRLAATGGLPLLWPETLVAIDVVLFERVAAEAASSEVPR